MSPVVGVDGCRGGWVVVEHDPAEADGTRRFTAKMLSDLRPLVHRLRAGSLGAVAIDMPIGLLDTQPRSCDVRARAMLGPRRSSVFPAPVRDTLTATDYSDACAKSRACSGKALSKQAFNLIPKIDEVDRLIRQEDQDRLVEAHPECAFVRLAGRTLSEPKRTAAGRDQRLRLLTTWDANFGELIRTNRDLPPLDLVDAAVLVITALHVVAGTEHRLGTDTDRRGLQARIVY